MEHICEVLSHIPKNVDGSYELYAHGDELTYGQDVSVELNVNDDSDISIFRWYLKNGYIVGDKRRHPISYCPFCGCQLAERRGG